MLKNNKLPQNAVSDIIYNVHLITHYFDIDIVNIWPLLSIYAAWMNKQMVPDFTTLCLLIYFFI